MIMTDVTQFLTLSVEPLYWNSRGVNAEVYSYFNTRVYATLNNCTTVLAEFPEVNDTCFEQAQGAFARAWPIEGHPEIPNITYGRYDLCEYVQYAEVQDYPEGHSINVWYDHRSCEYQVVGYSFYDSDDSLARYSPTLGWTPYRCSDIKVYPYHTNVPQLLGVQIPEELCLGIELEFSSFCDDDLYLTLESVEGKAIFKSDSSCGVELVSVPMVPSDMVDYVSNLQIDHLAVDSNCGVHIHLSRKYLTQSQLGGLVVFMNHPDNLAYVQAVAGRPANMYCKQIPGKTDTQSADRYEMVNLTNTHTIEVRIFAGTNQVGMLTGYVTWLVSLIKWLGTNPSNYSYTEFLLASES